MLLVESLIHVLIEKDVITSQEALDAVQTATDVKTEIAESGQEPSETAAASLTLLKTMSLSFGVSHAGADQR